MTPKPAKFRVLGVEDLAELRQLYARFGDCATLFREELVARDFTALERREMLGAFTISYWAQR